MPEERIAQLENDVEQLKAVVASMQNPATISPEFYQVLLRGVIQASAKVAADETITIDEAGAAVNSVADNMDGFIKIGGYNIPYYT